MDKKSDTRLIATAPALPQWVRDTDWENAPREAIFRPSHNEDGTFEMRMLPPTLYNLTHPEEEDDVSQSNRHYRTLDLVDDILRRRLERLPKDGVDGVGVFSDLMVYWDTPELKKKLSRKKSSPDIFVVFDMKRPPAEVGESFSVMAEGTRPSLIFEIVSATYKDGLKKDYEFNTRHYAKAGVRELALVEPMTEGSPFIRRLLVLRLGPTGEYQEVACIDGRYSLSTVGMTVHVEDESVVLCDAKTGERFLNSAETDEARLAVEEAYREEKETRQAAEKRAEDTLKTLLYERQAAETEREKAAAKEAALLAEIERLKRPQVH
jgi:hypothetical protein